MIQLDCFVHLLLGIAAGFAPQGKVRIAPILPEVIALKLCIPGAAFRTFYLSNKMLIIQRKPAGQPQPAPAGGAGKGHILLHPDSLFHTVYQR